MIQDFSELTKLEAGGICTAFGAIGGVLNYWLKVVEGKPFTWHELLLHACTSAFTGYLAYECLEYAGLPAGLCAALCGMAGWMGTRLLRIVEVIIQNRIEKKAND